MQPDRLARHLVALQAHQVGTAVLDGAARGLRGEAHHDPVALRHGPVERPVRAQARRQVQDALRVNLCGAISGRIVRIVEIRIIVGLLLPAVHAGAGRETHPGEPVGGIADAPMPGRPLREGQGTLRQPGAAARTGQFADLPPLPSVVGALQRADRPVRLEIHSVERLPGSVGVVHRPVARLACLGGRVGDAAGRKAFRQAAGKGVQR